jgi:iron complex transport system permease protein
MNLRAGVALRLAVASGGRFGVPRRALLALGVVCLGVMVTSVLVGAARLSAGDALRALVEPLGLADAPPRDVAVVWTLRVPRVLLAALVGAALAVSGTALQGLVRNPLADPALLGISTGAAVGAAAMLVLGLPLLAAAPAVLAPLLLPAAAFAAALVVTAIVVAIGQRRGTVGLVLAGIAMNAINGSILGLLLFIADDASLRSFTFWTLGSVGGATHETVGITAAVVVIATLGIWRQAARLDTLALGDAEARHAGVDVRRVMRWTSAWTAIAVGGAVAVAGPIGFVGIAVPHVIRAWLGAAHRAALPAAALGGATLLVVADALARTIATPREVPIGVITALVGGPFLIRIALRGAHA